MKKIILLCIPFLFTQCAVIRPGEVGIKQRLGKLKGDPSTSGLIGYNPIISRVIRTSTQTNNLLLALNLPSKEGLSVQADISILYHIDSHNKGSIFDRANEFINIFPGFISR